MCLSRDIDHIQSIAIKWSIVSFDFSVQILAEEAHSLDAFDVNAAKTALDEAQNQLNAAGDEVARAEAQIAVEVADALVKALA